MTGITPAQANVIRTWTEQRDALLAELGQLSSDRDALQKSIAEAADSLTDINDRVAEGRGRIAELNALEERYRTSLSADIAELEVRKSRLESECVAEERVISALASRKNEKVEDIKQLVIVHDKMEDQADIVHKVVGQVIENSTSAASEIKIIMNDVRAVAFEVIEKSKKNIAEANIVIEKMPKFIFDMQRPIPVRRTYPVGHPKYVDPHSAVTEA